MCLNAVAYGGPPKISEGRHLDNTQDTVLQIVVEMTPSFLTVRAMVLPVFQALAPVALPLTRTGDI